ncbi:helix-turn-helix domain-containing protein [Kibdelosporangium phytohabitans]|nr:helix-turn-helix domain-containing protein [Kibdelosporangium phytohabitans]MBE1466129.1 excisionase family DNA binding protein [Kibdelosporangium phytohabitans]
MERQLYRVEEAAKMLNIGRTRVFGLIRSGELESVKIGASRRVPAKAIQKYLDGLIGEAA